MPAFGWSAGDIVAATKVIATVVTALKDAGGASEEYQQTVEDLKALSIVLEQLQHVNVANPSTAHLNAIIARSASSQGALRDLIDEFNKFERSLGKTAASGWHRGTARKAQWALFASKQTKKLQKTLCLRLPSVALLLQSQQISSIQNVQEVVRSDLAHQLDQTQSVGGHMHALADVVNDLRDSNKMGFADLVTTTRAMESLSLDNYYLSAQTNADVRQQSKTLNRKLDDIQASMAQQRLTPLTVASECAASYEETLTALANSFSQLLCLLWLTVREQLLKVMILYPAMLSMLHATSLSLLKVPTGLLDSNIHLIDALGRSFDLQYTTFKSWKVFQALLEDQFVGCPGESQVRTGRFLLFHRNVSGQLVDSTSWQTKVMPGARIAMSIALSYQYLAGRRCPRVSCGKMATKTVDGSMFECISCDLRFGVREARPETVQCINPCCTGTVKVLDQVASVACWICGAKWFSRTDEDDQSRVEGLKNEHCVFQPTDHHNLIAPFVSIYADAYATNRGVLKDKRAIDIESFAKSLRPTMSTHLRSDKFVLDGWRKDSLLEAMHAFRRQEIQATRSHMEQRLREMADIEQYRATRREESDMELLKAVHLVDNTVVVDQPLALSSTAYHPARALMEARSRLRTLLQQEGPIDKPKLMQETDTRITDAYLSPVPGDVFQKVNDGFLLPTSKIRTPHKLSNLFVVVSEEGSDHEHRLVCLEITTYDGLGTTDPAILSSQHALIYAEGNRPLCLPEERGLLPSISMTTPSKARALDPMSRICFSKIIVFDHNSTKQVIGTVQGHAFTTLQDNLKVCFKLNIELDRAVQAGNVNRVGRALARGANPNAVIGTTRNVLVASVRAGEYDIASLLVRAGAAPFLGVAETMTDSALYQALRRHSHDLVAALLTRSICSRCCQEDNQKAVLLRAIAALTDQQGVRPWPLQARSILDDVHGIAALHEPRTEKGMRHHQIFWERLEFCPQMWPILHFLSPSEIALHRADLYEQCGLSEHPYRLTNQQVRYLSRRCGLSQHIDLAGRWPLVVKPELIADDPIVVDGEEVAWNDVRISSTERIGLAPRPRRIPVPRIKRHALKPRRSTSRDAVSSRSWLLDDAHRFLVSKNIKD